MIRDVKSMNRIYSSFLSCEKDIETILKKLFIENGKYSDTLKRLLILNYKDCLEDNSEETLELLKNTTLFTLRRDKYLRLEPLIKLPEHEEVKSYIIISVDNFAPDLNNPFYRDCTVSFDIICNNNYWDLGDYRIRPIKIAGYIDGLLNGVKLSGIGTFNFLGCNELILNEDFAGYTLSYRATHGNDDNIKQEEE